MKTILICFLFTISAFSQNDTIVQRTVVKQEPYIDVSIIQLIANPEKYDGKRIKVAGYVNLEFEGTALYLGREDFEHGLLKNALWLEMKSDRGGTFHKEFVSMIGTFDMKIKGHFGSYSGCIKSITSCYKI